nr:MAG TPA: hypothetical protein [Caudoviricetes sp.]
MCKRKSVNNKSETNRNEKVHRPSLDIISITYII